MEMRGRIIGESMRAAMALRPEKRCRVMTKAAAVPSAMARQAVETPTRGERVAAASQMGEVRSSAYQRNVRPLGGKLRKLDFVSETGMTKSDGSAMKARRRTTVARSAQRRPPR